MHEQARELTALAELDETVLVGSPHGSGGNDRLMQGQQYALAVRRQGANVDGSASVCLRLVDGPSITPGKIDA